MTAPIVFASSNTRNTLHRTPGIFRVILRRISGLLSIEFAPNFGAAKHNLGPLHGSQYLIRSRFEPTICEAMAELQLGIMCLHPSSVTLPWTTSTAT
jgi:hypothetical protein